MKLSPLAVSSCIFAGLLGLTPMVQAQDNLMITEFMASNNHTLLDQDGDASDWIELYNLGTNGMNLAGWRLTDDAADSAKWTFPVTNLAPNHFLVVFASGKNRAVSGAELHTSFSLSSGGEYLALVRPDGSVAQEFSPAFPAQVEDVSYGFAFNYSTNTLVAAGANAHWTIPHGAGEFPADWITTAFDDSGWSNGLTGLGYSANQVNVFSAGSPANVALNKTATQSSTFNNDPVNFGPQRAVNGIYSDFSHTFPTDAAATWEVNLGTNFGLDHLVLSNRTSNLSRFRDLTVRILTPDGSATNYASALLNPENVLGGGVLNQGPTSLSLNLTQLTGGLVLGGRVRVSRAPDPDLSGTGGQGSNSESNVLAMAEVEAWGIPLLGTSNVFGTIVKTDLRVAMSNVNATAMIRMPFNIGSGATVPNFVTLQMKYNAGFIAYLNGVEVARRNAPSSPAWNSTATAGQSDAAAVQFDNIDISAYLNLLQAGPNVLAIQGLNLSANNNEFLILPQLIATSLTLTPDQYFSAPTPGAPNAGGALGVVADPQFSVGRGFYNAPFSLTITSATVNAQIRFTTDGSAPSSVNGTFYSGAINVTNTAVIRAVATLPGYLPSATVTHTYVFRNSALVQTLQSVTNSGFPATWTGTTPDYDMDPTITTQYTSAQLLAALQSLPSMFVTTSVSNLFDPATGIYVHPTLHGSAWERPAAIELVDTNGQSQFEVSCGLRIQGGAFRAFSFTQKKSFRVLFKSEYGPGKLHYKLFEQPDATQDFNTLVFRASGNDGYMWASGGTTVQYIRDEFGRRLYLDMGHLSPHGIFVHLYLNGLYWGLYNVAERPNEDFSSTYYGDDSTQWDAISGSAMNTTPLKNGDWNAWTALTNLSAHAGTYADYEKMQGRNADGTRNTAYPVYYDKLDYMDYMIVNIWGGNWDWPANNFWLGYDHANPDRGMQFYMWDYENVIGNTRSAVDFVAPKALTWTAYPYSFLKNNSEFRTDFADRVQKYFFNGGLLSTAVLTNRYLGLATSVQAAMILESARWGDDNITPPLGLPEWTAERDWVVTNYIPLRNGIVLNQFMVNGLFPTVTAPVFSQFGGPVPAGYNLSVTQSNSTGVIYYTVDGSDPRVAGTGTVAVSAQAYVSPIVINGPTLVRARVLSGSSWSPLVEALFQPPQDLSQLELTEIMYDPPNSGTTNSDSLEFIELKNVGATTLDLSGLIVNGGIHFTFTNGTFLGVGQFFVLARDANAFHTKYPSAPLNGLYTGKLSNGGDTITLQQTNGAAVFSVTYDNKAPWPVTPHGFGYSLVQKNPGLKQAPNDGSAWRASSFAGGSPGADDPAATIPTIVVNEVLANSTLPLVDAVELFNPTASDVDVGGWYLTDDSTVPQKYHIPSGRIVPAGGFLTFDESQFNPTPGVGNSFAFSSTGEAAYLFSGTSGGQLTGYSHGLEFGASFAGVTFGRYLNSVAEEQFPAQISRTLGDFNSGPAVAPVVITEIQYHPAAGGDEFIELLNTTTTNISCFDPVRPTNTWKIHGLSFTFPTNVILAGGQFLLVVATNPPDFRSKYGVPAGVQIIGPFTGVLQDSGEFLELQTPDVPVNNSAPYVTIDGVRYNDKAPWPPGADGSGRSLQRVSVLAYGNDPVNWIADLPTPGSLGLGTDSDGDGMPDAWEMANGTDWRTRDATLDADGDGFSNLQEFLAGTNPQDASSYLKVLDIAAGGGSVTLQFYAASNHTYSVIYTSPLENVSWGTLTNVPAQSASGVVTVTDPNPDALCRFYRLVTPAQP
jgi:hypothetical protein